jgi:hypothetical protein
VAIETKLGITSGDSILGARVGVGITAISNAVYVAEFVHNAVSSWIIHRSSQAYSTGNLVTLGQAAMTNAQVRTMFSIQSNFSDVADATRTTTTLLKVCNAGAFSTFLQAVGLAVTIPSLAGAGSRHVMVDANGLLSAP